MDNTCLLLKFLLATVDHMKDFVQLPNKIFVFMGKAGLTPLERLVFLELTTHNVDFFPSRTFLGDALSSDSRYIKRCLKVLEAKGFIVEAKSKRFSGGVVKSWSTEPGMQKLKAFVAEQEKKNVGTSE